MSTRKTPSKSSLASKLPRYVKKTAAEYHADKTAYGRSALWTFHESRRQFEAEEIYQDAPPREKSKKMDIGTLCHYGLLEPEKFPSQYSVIPAKLLGSNGYENTTAAAKFRAENEAAGKVVLKQADFETVTQVVESVRFKLDSLGWLGVKSRREQAVYWTEPTTGLPCKTLLDWLIVGRELATVIDFKTTGDATPDVFRHRIEDGGLWLQDSHYSEAAALVTGLPVWFLFVVCETKFPFRCSVVRLSDRDRAAAADRRRGIFAELQNCLRTGDFSETWEDRVTELTLRPSCYA
jgi:hypothetical protein